MEAKRAELHLAGIRAAAAIVLAVDVEVMQMLIVPVESDLEDGVEVSQGGVAADEETAPDENADLSQDDTQLIDAGRFNGLAHALSVAQSAAPLKTPPEI